MINVSLFAGLAERLGKRTVEVPVDQAITVSELRQLLADNYPVLRDLLPQCMIAVNKEYADDEEPVKGSDEVVLISPVSGG